MFDEVFPDSGGEMETAARAEAAPSATGDEAGADQVVAEAASTDPRRALANIAQQHVESVRRRRWKRAFQAALVLGVLGALLMSPRFREHGRAAAPTHGAAPAAPAAGSDSAHLAAAPATPIAPAHEAQQLAAVPAAPEDPDARCEHQFKARAWRTAIESCSVAFDAAPSPALAMRIAHARFAHGDAEGAGTWARNALELGSADPDAYVLIGNAELAAGKRRKAIAAYRRYLDLAPRGWHAARLRGVVGGTREAAQ